MRAAAQGTTATPRSCGGTPTATCWPPAPTTAPCACGTCATAAPRACSSATAPRCAPCLARDAPLRPSARGALEALWRQRPRVAAGLKSYVTTRGVVRNAELNIKPSLCITAAKHGGRAPQITALAFSPDGRALASADAEGALAVWDLGEARRTGGARDAHRGPAWALAYSQGAGSLLASGARGAALSVSCGRAGRGCGAAGLRFRRL